MNKLFKEYPMTFLLGVIAMIVVLVGGITVILGTYDDDFAQWVNDLIVLAGAVGLLGAGRAVKKGMLGRDDEPPIGEDDLPGPDSFDEDIPADDPSIKLATEGHPEGKEYDPDEEVTAANLDKP